MKQYVSKICSGHTALRSRMILLLLLILGCGLFGLAACKAGKGYRERTTFSLSNGIHELEHSRTTIHPVMAEYNRDITVITHGRRGPTLPLHRDTCGGYPINCYVIQVPGAGSFLRMEDAVSEHLLDLNGSKLYQVVRIRGTAYLGGPNEEIKSRGHTMTGDDLSSVEIEINNKPAVPMATLTKNTAEKYIGRLDGKRGWLKFIPASEGPAAQIRRMDEEKADADLEQAVAKDKRPHEEHTTTTSDILLNRDWGQY